MIDAGTAWLSPHDELTITEHELVWLDLTEFAALMSAVIEQPGVTVWRYDEFSGTRWKIIADREPPCITALGNSRVVPVDTSEHPNCRSTTEPIIPTPPGVNLDDVIARASAILNDKARGLFGGDYPDLFGSR